MTRMVVSGEVDALVPERVWTETARALGEPAPQVFIRVLRDCDALSRILPEIDRLFGVPQPRCSHPEEDTGLHLLLALEQAARLDASTQARFAVLVHDVGKGLTPRALWPEHPEHELRGVEVVRRLCERFRVPNDYRNLALLVVRHHEQCHRATALGTSTVFELLTVTGAFRQPNALEDFLAACEADARGREGFENRPYPAADLLRAAQAAGAPIKAAPFVDQGLEGAEIGRALNAERRRAVEQSINRFSSTTEH